MPKIFAYVKKKLYICVANAKLNRTMAVEPFTYRITELGKSILPKGAHLWLYGSRARGDFRADSDWDLLVLLDKDKRTNKDFEKYSFPFSDFGFSFGELISPHIYTTKQWKELAFTPFVKNVEQDKIVLI